MMMTMMTTTRLTRTTMSRLATALRSRAALTAILLALLGTTLPAGDLSAAESDPYSSDESRRTPDWKGRNVRSFKSAFQNLSIRLAVEAAGPLLFPDVPDATLEATTVYQFGGRFSVVFGDELRDVHRIGFGVAYDFAAQSESRKLSFLQPRFIYETGHPLVFHLGLGGNIGLGTEDYAMRYSGLGLEAGLRFSFLRARRWSPISVSPGLLARLYIVPTDLRMASAFLGMQIEVSYNTNRD